MRRCIDEFLKDQTEDETYTANTNTSQAQTGTTHDDNPPVDLDGHPFTAAIMMAPFPEKFKTTKDEEVRWNHRSGSTSHCI